MCTCVVMKERVCLYVNCVYVYLYFLSSSLFMLYVQHPCEYVHEWTSAALCTYSYVRVCCPAACTVRSTCPCSMLKAASLLFNHMSLSLVFRPTCLGSLMLRQSSFIPRFILLRDTFLLSYTRLLFLSLILSLCSNPELFHFHLYIPSSFICSLRVLFSVFVSFIFSPSLPKTVISSLYLLFLLFATQLFFFIFCSSSQWKRASKALTEPLEHWELGPCDRWALSASFTGMRRK